MKVSQSRSSVRSPGSAVGTARDDAQRQLSHWIGRIALGDRAAFRALYEATSAHLLGVAFQLLHNRAEAEDMLQEAFVNVWKRAASFDPAVASPMTWLINIVRNRAIDQWRAARRERESTVALDDEHTDTLAAFEPLPEQQLLRALQAAQLQRAIDRLPRLQKQALALVLYRGLSYPEVAAAAGVPLPTAKSWVRRGLERLRQDIDAATT